jgi:hypothetical protein
MAKLRFNTDMTKKQSVYIGGVSMMINFKFNKEIMVTAKELRD